MSKHAAVSLSHEEKIMLLKLLEMQKNAMLMYTSCGWFFDEISGIETVQVMQYADQAIQLAEELGQEPIEEEYRKRLEAAPSNLYGNGSHVFEKFVKPAQLDLLRVGAHYAITSLFEEYPESVQIHCYTAQSEVYNRTEAGRSRLAIGKSTIVSNLTWEEQVISFAVLHLGDHNINGGVRDFQGEEAFSAMQKEIRAAFDMGSISDVILLINKHFGTHTYSVWHLFKDQQRKIVHQILQLTYESIESAHRQIYENNYIIMNFLQSLNAPLPRPLTVSAEHILNTDLQRVLEAEDLDLERLEHLIYDVKRWSLKLDDEILCFVANARVDALMEKLDGDPDDANLIQSIDDALRLLSSVSLLDLWKAQNIYFSIGKNLYGTMKDLAGHGDESARKWLEVFHNLGLRLHVKIVEPLM